MDASKITELRQKQANTYINRAQQSQDASLITWQKQIAASRYLPATRTASVEETSNPQNLGGCRTCGANATINISQNSTVASPNPMFSSKGSGSQIYSSDFITYKRAGDQACGTATVNSITEPSQLFIQLPKCFCNEVDRYPLPQSECKWDYVDATVSGECVIFTYNQAAINQPPGYSAPPPTDAANSWLNPYLPIPQPYIADTVPPQCNCAPIRRLQPNCCDKPYVMPPPQPCCPIEPEPAHGPLFVPDECN